MSDPSKKALKEAFIKGFMESAEGWNGEMVSYNEKAMRRVKHRFDALYDSGAFDTKE